jgi:hypothetical protein
LEGNGLGVSEGEAVSVAISVGVSEAVSVGAGSVTVSAIGENAVLVGGSVLAEVAGTKVAVELQANEANINKIRKIRFRLIG